MSDEFRSNILVDLQGDFSAEQLKTIDLAIAHAMRGYKIEKEETLPASTTQQFPMDIKEFLIRKEMKGCSSGTLVQYRNLFLCVCQKGSPRGKRLRYSFIFKI